MTERETTRLVAWADEMRRMHARLRQALRVTQRAVREGRPIDPRDDASGHLSADLLLFCRGFCTALDEHHRGEDQVLFPAIAAAHPELAPVLAALSQDHSMVAHLLQELGAAADQAADPAVLQRHLDGVAALMESHFRYEERQLLVVLERSELDAAVQEVLGPL